MTVSPILTTPEAWPRILLPAGLPADPIDLDAAVAGGAFDGLRRAVQDLGPGGTIAAIAASRLRGRGGAGFPTADKWRACAGAPVGPRTVVANGYGADPRSFTDRTLLETNPYAVIEGLLVAAWAVGAEEAIVAVRSEAVETIRILEAAIAATEEAGFAGPDAAGSGLDVALSVRPVQGAYMLGEETVLLKALEGKRGQPEQRPPHPAVDGLFGRPTVVNNVQTLAAVPWILANGAERFAAIGTPASPGTILVEVHGATRKAGVAEVPLGTSLRDIVRLAGGVTRGHKLKAVLVGGPSGGFLPERSLTTPYEFEALRDAGAHLGSGSILVADERACIVDLGRLLTRFCADEACGKSIPCRIGTRRLAEIADRFTSGRPRPTDVELLTDLSSDIVGSALCDHERLTTYPLASGMRYFRPEVDDHLLRGSCPAGVCEPIAVVASGTA